MPFELLFVYGLLVFCCVVMAMRAVRFFTKHFYRRKSLLRIAARRFEKKYPVLLEDEEDFYAFFPRGLFHMS